MARVVGKYWRRALLVIAGLLAVVVSALGAGVLYLNTDVGKRDLTAWANDYLADETGQIVLGPIEGTLLSGFTVSRVDVSDNEGVWLEVERATINWSPWSLFSGDLKISSSHIDRVNAKRLPITSVVPANDVDTNPLAFSLPALPVNIIIDQFNADAININAGLVGVAARFRGQGALRYADSGGVVLKADLVSEGKTKDRVTIDIVYPEDANRLTVDVSVVAPRGGFFGAVAGIDAQYDMTANFKGRGTIDDWNGQLTARVGETDIAKADLLLKDQTISVRAQLDAGNYIPDDGAALFGSTASLNLDVSPTERGERRNLSMSLLADTMQLRANGSILTEELAVADNVVFDLEIVDAKPFNRLFAPASFQPFKISGTLSGIANEPKIIARFAEMTAVAYEAVSANVGGEFEILLTPESFAVNASGQLSDLQGKAIAAYEQLLCSHLNWVINGTYDRQTMSMSLNRFSLENEQIDVALSGSAQEKFSALNADVSLVLKQLNAVLPEVNGRAELTAKVDRASVNDALNASINLVTENIVFNDEMLSDFVGQSPTATAKVTRLPSGEVSVSGFSAQGKVVSAGGVATITPDQVIEYADFEVEFADLAQVEGLNGMQIDGGVDISLEVSGHLSSPSISAVTELSTLDLQSLYIENIDVRASAHQVFSLPTGQIQLDGETSFGPLQTKAAFASNANNSFSLNDLAVTLGRYSAQGSITFPSGQPVDGVIQIATDNNESLSSPNLGVIQGQVKLLNQNNVQQIEVSGNLSDIVVPISNTDLLTADKGVVSVTMLLKDDMPEMTGKVTVSTLSHPRFQASSIELIADQANQNTTYEIRAEGTKLMPYNLNAVGNVERRGEELGVTLALDGSIGESVVKSSEALELVLSDAGFVLEPFSLKIGDGNIDGNISLKDGIMAAMVKAEQVETAFSRVFFPEIPVKGRLDGTAQLNVRSSQQTGAGSGSVDGGFDLKFSDVQAVGGDLIIEQGIELNIAGDMANNIVSVTGTAQLPSVVDARFSGTFPVEINPDNISVVFPDDKAIAGELSWYGDVALIWPVFGLVNHDVSGAMDASLNVSGTYAVPDVDGHIKLKKGRYENAQTGFVAANIDLATTVTDRRLVVDYLTATDGGGGLVEVDGVVQFHQDLSFDADANVKLDKARLVRRPQMSVTASSLLKFTKTGDVTALTGDVTVDSANIGAIARDEASVIELDVREINGASEAIIPIASTQGSYMRPLSLDVNFNAPGKLYIRTYGMDAEWSSDVKISGTSLAPIVTGTATLTRGTFDFSGKRFKLTRGNLTFVGDKKNDPLLDISAENQLTDLTAILTIGGKASAPTIEVSSIPSLPQDEVISRIFFGASVADLSPVEAVQLAATIHSLSTGGGQGVIGGIRRTLGIDRLSIDQASARDYGTTITGGKYLTNNIYVEVTTAPATGETATAVEVGLTKNLSLITRRTLDHDNNLAIRWSWNY